MARYPSALVMMALITLLAACSSGNAPVTFALCGNGVLNPGEQCDEGSQNSDFGNCLTTCKLAVCGDSFVDLNREQCDSNNLTNPTAGCGAAACSCQNLGFGAGTLTCNPSCQFDTSQCGPAFPPTPTPSPTPFETPTPSPTPTPVSMCGDGLLEPGETCETCPADCIPLPCTPAPPLRTVAVNLAAPAGQGVSRVGVLVAYRTNIVTLPSSGVSSRVRNRPPNSLVTAAGLGYALRVTVTTPSALPPGQIFTVDFDSCQGAAAPATSDFACTVESCANTGGAAIDGCTCAVTVQ